RLVSPLAWYVRAEAALAVLGSSFHPVFLRVTDLSYDVIFPALPGAAAAGAARWGIAALLLLPQAMLLGATFPLMSAALVRADPRRPGRGVATVYLVNTLGGAAGVLLAGFWLVGAVGLPGTVAAAAALNAAAALLAWSARGSVAGALEPGVALVPERHPGQDVSPSSAPAALAPPDGESWRRSDRGLVPLLLSVSFLTAVASFAYEIGWIRMLSLVLGSATHAFELMLSAFILGLALGAWAIRKRSDRSRDPLRLLGSIQIAMGLAALATLPLYVAAFPVMAYLVQALPAREDGYIFFNAARYALCLAVMIPSTLMAGMTLPVITGTLLRAGRGEASIGRVYGVNTIGSVLGSALAGLVALPLLGLKGLLLAGAALDVALGLWLLERSARWAERPRRGAAMAAAATLGAFLLVGWGARLDKGLLTSGVFRYGTLPRPGDTEILFYGDGRTATVSAHVTREDGSVVLSTNGKPDASLGARWYARGRDTLPEVPLEEGQDFTTQVLAPLVGLAHHPDARSVANVGHGSGMTGAAFLTSPSLRRLVTIEIEPLMVDGSFVFLPMNRAVFDDPRSSFAFDDAKSFFAYRQERFDLIFAEPSNPWVSGTASLFTREFYERVKGYLGEGGVLVQWMQIYEISDDLFLSVLAALDSAFPSYRAYLVGDADVVIVASPTPGLHPPDWSVLDMPDVRAMTHGIPPFRAEHMASLFLFDEETFRPLLDEGVTANSDFHPVLDLGAERARFMGWRAEGLFSMAANRLDLRRMLADEPQVPLAFSVPPALGLEPALTWG
ncbi:MAG: hypothetical protein FIA95_12930, partial [Gemmatimonadetes bacterium]|nr:hypothetical protein [Gemmatimonadota bacterium]